jgi:hypothetical protein
MKSAGAVRQVGSIPVVDHVAANSAQARGAPAESKAMLSCNGHMSCGNVGFAIRWIENTFQKRYEIKTLPMAF